MIVYSVENVHCCFIIVFDRFEVQLMDYDPYLLLCFLTKKNRPWTVDPLLLACFLQIYDMLLWNLILISGFNVTSFRQFNFFFGVWPRDHNERKSIVYQFNPIHIKIIVKDFNVKLLYLPLISWQGNEDVDGTLELLTPML